jgi:hypothetical protein
LKTEELLHRIKQIIFSVPHEIYRYKQPEDCFDIEWKESTSEEKAYLLIEELLINENKAKVKNKIKENSDIYELNLGKCPTFFNGADENMFFNAIYSIPSYVEIKGIGEELLLYYSKAMTKEEKFFLEGLFRRYGMDIPEEINHKD